MQKKTIRLILILIATIAISLLLTTSVNAADVTGSWTKADGASSYTGVTLTINYGEGDGIASIQSQATDAGLRESRYYNYYAFKTDVSTLKILDGKFYDGTTVVTAPDNTQPTFGYKSNVLGHETVVFTITNGHTSANNDAEVEVYCVTTDAFKDFMNSLGEGTMANNYTIDASKLPEITAETVDAIIAAETAYNGLSDAEKALADSKIAEKGASYKFFAGTTETLDTYAKLLAAAKDFINLQANLFLRDELQQDITKDVTIAPTDLDEDTSKIVDDAKTVWDNLPENVQAKVNELLVNTTYEDLYNEAQEILDTKAANDFIEEYNLEEGCLDELNADKKDLYEDIVSEEFKTDFDNLRSDNARSKVLSFVDFSADFDENVECAQEYLDEIAVDEFVEKYNLVEGFELFDQLSNILADAINDEELSDEEIEQLKTILEDLNEIAEDVLSDEFSNDYDNLSDGAKAIFGGEDEVEFLKEIAEEIVTFNDLVDFASNHILTEDLEQIIAGEERFNNYSEEEQTIINEVTAILMQEEELTYPELVERAKEELIRRQAEEFISNNLIKDSEIIAEANNNNYQQILDAEDDYELLPDEVKDMVNQILESAVETTYPELLEAAKKLAPTPKTGDFAIIMGAVFVVSVLGLAITIKKRK